MKLSTKDAAGIFLVLGTAAVLTIHNGPFGHQASHSGAVADAGGSVTRPSGVRPTAFIDFNVVPMDGDRVLRNQVVIVRGSFIERIGRVGFVEPPRDALRIEGDGTSFLLPGLTDAHVHLRGGYEEWLPLFIANRVTPVFNLEGDEEHLAAQDRVWTERLPWPAIYTAGPYLGEPLVRTAAGARAAVARQVELGYDFLKIRGPLTSDAYRALTEAALEHDIPVIGHAPRSLPFSAVLESGQVALSHAEEVIQTRLWTLDESELPNVAADIADAGIWVIPTVAHFDRTAAQWASPAGLARGLETDAARYLTRRQRSEWRNSNPFVDRDSTVRAEILAMRDFHRPLIRALHEHDVPLLAGSDAPLPMSVPGFSLHDEIEALAGAGLSRYAALAASTRGPGSFVRAHVPGGAAFGVLEPGARADILMVDGDPRRDLALLRRPAGVMVRGQWYPRGALAALLTERAEAEGN